MSFMPGARVYDETAMTVPADTCRANGLLRRLWPGNGRAARRTPERTLSVQVREAADGDAEDISLLQTLAFQQDNEARLTEALRERGLMRAEIVAISDGLVAGQMPVAALHAPSDWATLLPVALFDDLDEYRDALVREMLAAAIKVLPARGVSMLVSTGEPDTARASGFTYTCAGLIESPFPKGQTGLFPLEGGDALPSAPMRLEYPSEILDA